MQEATPFMESGAPLVLMIVLAAFVVWIGFRLDRDDTPSAERDREASEEFWRDHLTRIPDKERV